ncbi:hypothetical protein DMA11_12480 [Marinilabiliaceae bacterium JC017]|nr:hypothetical protein DMA11_12480 [Marinilabiliaceae bacterium JC017]
MQAGTFHKINITFTPEKICFVLNDWLLSNMLIEIIGELQNENPYIRFEIFKIADDEEKELPQSVLLSLLKRFVYPLLYIEKKLSNYSPHYLETSCVNIVKSLENVRLMTGSKTDLSKKDQPENVVIGLGDRQLFQYLEGMACKTILLDDELPKGDIFWFITKYLYNHQPLKFYSIEEGFSQRVIWNHYFQTLEYGVAKNIRFFKYSIKVALYTLSHTTPHFQQDLPGPNRQAAVGNVLKAGFFLFKTMAGKVVKRLLKKIFKARWGIILVPRKDDVFPDVRAGENLFLLSKNRDGWADPFLVDDDEHTHLFLEILDGYSRKGRLAVLTLNNVNNKLQDIIHEPFHLSYPNVIKADATWYMIPESSHSKGVRLYKSNQFPFQWQFERELIPGIMCLDYTPFFYNQKWWHFTIIKSHELAGSYDLLYLFHSNHLFNDPWQPHLQNPIVTDSSKARMAGRIYMEDGQIYRPSQNCFDLYGGEIWLNKIITLNEQVYEEETVKVITPQTFGTSIRGVHTYNRSDDFYVYDGIFKLGWKGTLKGKCMCQ